MTSDQTGQAVLESVKSCLKTVLSPKAGKTSREICHEPYKRGLQHSGISARKYNSLPQLPGSVLSILGFKILDHKSVVMFFNIVK